MATKKNYAYYVKGNRLAIAQRETNTTSTDLRSEDYGKYKSPQETVSEGLELQYTYSPDYFLPAAPTVQREKFYMNGWTVVNGYLTFVRSHLGGVPDWTASPYSNVTTGVKGSYPTKGSTGGIKLNEDYIVVRNSSKWNGLHKVRDADAYGMIQTYTKVNSSFPSIIGSSTINIDAEVDTDSDGVADSALIKTTNGSNYWLNAMFSAGDYIFVKNSATDKNNGMWEIDSVAADSSDEITSGVYVKNKYYCYDGDNTLSTEGIDTTPDTTADTAATMYIYGMERDFCYILTDVSVIADEEDTLDIPRYLCNAVVCYVKAQLAMDAGDIQMQQYYMREFRRKVEKHSSAKKIGPSIIQGNRNLIRR